MGWQDAPIVNAPPARAPPAWMSAPIVSQAKPVGYGVSDVLGAAPETTMHLASGAIASPVAGLAGLATMAGSGLAAGEGSGEDVSDAAGKAANVVEKVQNALTYQPRTQGGQDLTKVVEYLPQKLGEGANWAGEKTADATGSPAAGAAINTAIQALPAFVLHRALPAARAAAAPRAATASPAVQAAGSIGIRLTPEEAQSGFVGRAVQSLSGAAKLERENARRNATDVNAAATNQVGLTDTSPAAFDAARAPHNAVYDAMSQIGNVPTDTAYQTATANVANRTGQGSFGFRPTPDIQALRDNYSGVQQFDAADAVQEVRQLRASARQNLNAPHAPDQNALGHAQLQIANAIEDQLDRHIQAGSFVMPDGSPLTVDRLRGARQSLAQLHSVEDALDTTNVSPRELHRQLERGVPLTGNLRTIAEAYGNFPRSLQDVSAIRNSGPFSVLDGTVGTLLGGAGHLAGLPVAAATGPAVAAMLARPLARASLASRLYQRYGVQGHPLPIGRPPAQALIPAELAAQDDERPNLLDQLTARYPAAAHAKGGKVETVMHEFKRGALHSGSKRGPMVRNRKQAIAIALSEQRKYDSPLMRHGK